MLFSELKLLDPPAPFLILGVAKVVRLSEAPAKVPKGLKEQITDFLTIIHISEFSYTKYRQMDDVAIQRPLPAFLIFIEQTETLCADNRYSDLPWGTDLDMVQELAKSKDVTDCINLWSTSINIDFGIIL